MAHAPAPQPHDPSQPQDSPYCSDPNCESCKELRKIHEMIRANQPIPRK